MGTKISEFLSATTPLGGTELVPIVQSGVTVKTTVAAIKTTNAADLATGTVAIARLPVSSTSSSGIVRLGTTSGLACEGNDIRLSDARIPLGGAGGDLTGAYPSPALTTTGVAALTYGSASSVGVLIVDAKGRITGATSQPVAISGSQVTSGIVAATYLPAGTTAAAGVLRLGTTSGTAIQGNDPRIGGGGGFVIFNTAGVNQSIPANAIPAWVTAVKVTVIGGGGGAGNTTGSNGGNGESSSFSVNGITITATGGGGGIGGIGVGSIGGTGGGVPAVSGYVGLGVGGAGVLSSNTIPAVDGSFSIDKGIGMGGGGGGTGTGGGSGCGFGGSSAGMRGPTVGSTTQAGHGGGLTANIGGGIINGGSGAYGLSKPGLLYGGGGGGSASFYSGGGGGGAAVFNFALNGATLYANAITVGAGGATPTGSASGAQGVVVIEW